MNCHCGSGKKFSECCEPFLQGKVLAESPEQLMRSRYCAFVTKNWDYLVQTVDPQKQVDFSHQANRDWMEKSEFVGLEVLGSSMENNKGFVEFKASYIENGKTEVHHEKSKFRKLGGKWYYRP